MLCILLVAITVHCIETVLLLVFVTECCCIRTHLACVSRQCVQQCFVSRPGVACLFFTHSYWHENPIGIIRTSWFPFLCTPLDACQSIVKFVVVFLRLLSISCGIIGLILFALFTKGFAKRCNNWQSYQYCCQRHVICFAYASRWLEMIPEER